MSVRESLEGSRLLVTGVTGFVGKVWLTMVLDHAPSVGRITVLIRGRRGESAQSRMAHIVERSPAFRPLRQRLGSGLWDLIDEKIEVVEGDVGKPLCGLGPEQAERLAARLDAVVHFAGLTDFEPDPVQAIRTNILGGENAADLTALLTVPRLIHVSTAFVAGAVSGRVQESIRPGVSPLGERFDPAAELEALQRDLEGLETRGERVDAANARAHALGWPNIYTYTKGLSEHLLERREDIWETVIRPTVVESARQYPFPGWNEGINTSGPLVWLLASWFRKLPSRPDNHFDVIPVDTVARATTVILAEALEDRAEHVYQLGSSDTNPMLFERAIELTGLAARRMHSKPDASPVARLVLKYLDAVPGPTDHDPFPSLKLLRRAAGKARTWLKDLDLGEVLPPSLHREHGERLQERIRSWSMECRNADRVIGRIEDMLRLYRPFIHDNDYVFCTDRIRALSDALDSEEKALFGFDIATLDWRSYWLDVHVPGLEKWSLPLLRNERIADDPPMLPARAERRSGIQHRHPERPSDHTAEHPAEHLAEHLADGLAMGGAAE